MLRQLELFGFKSFADRTAFDFAPGITCVVGPNGSGKSNVVDAIKWILGDQSAKSLRGKEMADVIFNGSAGRKASGFAEATLTFDNTTRLLRVDADEVRVGRRLYRSGESEYLLNGAVVRLKDVRDALLGTGAGTSAYSIIEQGRVDQILQANPTTRRVVFEEAAGVSRYKNRRVDAERRLERVDQNLVRLRDIVQEVQSQLTTMRSQATRATKFRELSSELRTVWTGHAADEYRRLTTAAAACHERVHELRAQLEQVQSELGMRELAQAEIESALVVAEEKYGRQQRERSANREQIAVREATIRHQTTRQREMDAELEQLRHERRNLAVRARAVAVDLRTTAAAVSELERSLAEQESVLAERTADAARLQADASAARELLEERRGRQAELARAGSEAENREAVLGAQRVDVVHALSLAVHRRHETERIVAEAEQALDQRRATAEQAALRLRECAGVVDRLQRERLRLFDEQGHSEHSLSAMRDQRIAWDARLQILERLEQRQEGLAQGVRDVLQRARTSPVPPWNEIVDCVGDLLEVSLEHAPLLEVALGNRAQLVVTRDLESLSEHLNSSPGALQGRVGFIEAPQSEEKVVPPFRAGNHGVASELSTVCPAEAAPIHGNTADLGRPGSGTSAGSARDDEAATADLFGRPGVVARGDQLAMDPEHVRGLAARLLSDTWIVESLSDAWRLAPEFPTQRFVTLQGELLEPGGVLHAGLSPQETSLVSRRSELRQLRIDLRKLDGEIAEQVRELTLLVKHLTSIDAAFAAAEAEQQSAARAQDEARVLFDAQQREVDRLRLRLDQARTEEQELSARIAVLDEEVAGCRAAAERSRSGAAAEEMALGELAAQIREAESLLSVVQEESSRQELELARHRERANSLREVQSRLERDQSQREAQSRQAASRLAAAIGVRRDLTLKILAAEADVAAFALVGESLDAAVGAVELERSSLRSRRAMLSRELDQLDRRRRSLTDDMHAVEMQLREIRQAIANWETRIEEEFQLSLADLAASGVSALARFSDVMNGGEEGRESLADGNSSAGENRQTSAPLPGTPWAPPPGTDGGRTADLSAVSDDERRAAIEEHVQKLRRKLKALGHVNTEALESLEELESRHAHLSAQLQDLVEAKTALEEIIRRINGESRRLFTETFEVIRGHFRELFRKLFGGGEADIILEDPTDVLECGIDIVARPPGKELRSITLLSGGEKTLTAIALLFAMFKSKPSPYCILDEVDAALDEANVERYASILGEFIDMTQFVVITHRKRTMTAADVIYGVTMEQAGVSKRMSVRFEDVSDNGEIQNRSGKAA